MQPLPAFEDTALTPPGRFETLNFTGLTSGHGLGILAADNPTGADIHAAIDGATAYNIQGLPPIPVKRQRKIGKFFYAPAATPGDILPQSIAHELVSDGFQVAIGAREAMDKCGHGDLPPGVVLFRHAHVQDARMMFKAISNGHFVVLALDAMPDALAYRMATCQAARELADVVMVPDAATAEMLKTITDPAKVHAVSDIAPGHQSYERPSVGIQLKTLFHNVIGEKPTPEMLARLHERATRGDVRLDVPELCAVAQPMQNAKAVPLTIAQVAHKVWQRNQFEMPFDVGTAWAARAHKSSEQDATFDVPHAYLAAPETTRLERGVWALRPAHHRPPTT